MVIIGLAAMLAVCVALLLYAWRALRVYETSTNEYWQHLLDDADDANRGTKP